MKKKEKTNVNNKKSLAYLISSIVLFIAFIVWTILVCFNKFDALNTAVHNFILHLFISEMSQKIFEIITFFGCTIWIVALCAIIFFIFIFKKKYGKATGIGSVIIISTIINNVVKVIVREPRPSYMPVGLESTFAYPSGHTMASITTYGFIIYLISKTTIPKKYKYFYGVLLSILALAVMTSRIYLGAHYFNDIVGGIFASTSLLLFFAYLDNKKGIIEKLDNLKLKKKKQSKK